MGIRVRFERFLGMCVSLWLDWEREWMQLLLVELEEVGGLRCVSNEDCLDNKSIGQFLGKAAP